MPRSAAGLSVGQVDRPIICQETIRSLRVENRTCECRTVSVIPNWYAKKWNIESSKDRPMSL